MRLSVKGQVTLPAPIREQLGLRPGVELDARIEGDSVRLTPRHAARWRRPSKARVEAMIRQLGRYADRYHFTTDQVMGMTRGED